MIREVFKVEITDGLHARPAAEFVRLAQLADHTVLVSKPGGKSSPGDSILALMSLGVQFGQQIMVEVSGPNEISLLQSLKSIVQGK